MVHVHIPTLIAIAALSVACASSKEAKKASPAPQEVARAAEVVAPYDLKFIDSMTHHHQNGVAMAQIAWRKASNEELRALAKEMADDHRREIARMQEWREEWFGGVASARDDEMPGIPDPIVMDVLSKLEQANGAEFDLVFIEMILRHHEDAVAMANDALEHATRGELKSLAQEMIEEQPNEHQQLQSMRDTALLQR